MCSDKRTEFVNESRKGYIVQFDDAGFVLGDAERIKGDTVLQQLGFWTTDDKRKFEKSLSEAQNLIIAPLGIAGWHYFTTPNGNLVRVSPFNMKKIVDEKPVWFFSNFTYIKLEPQEKIAFILNTLSSISSKTPRDCNVFVLGAVTGKELPAAGHDGISPKTPQRPTPPHVRKEMIDWRSLVNAELTAYCAANPKFHYIDVEKVVPPSEQYMEDHYTRRGYMAIRDSINEALSAGRAESGALDTAARLEALERENRQLRQDNEVLKRGDTLLAIGQKAWAKGYFALAKRNATK
jgi:hypothetical protein